MGEYTDKDRERDIQTNTLLAQHMKISDERHQEYIEKFGDHEKRIRVNETFRNWMVGLVGIGGAGGLGTIFKFLDK